MVIAQMALGPCQSVLLEPLNMYKLCSLVYMQPGMQPVPAIQMVTMICSQLDIRLR